MKRIIVSIIGTLSLLSATSAFAAAPRANIPTGFVKLAPQFCESLRFTGEVYRPFVEAKAIDETTLSRAQLLEFAQDPKKREALRRKNADRWGTRIAEGQKARCTSVTYWN